MSVDETMISVSPKQKGEGGVLVIGWLLTQRRSGIHRVTREPGYPSASIVQQSVGNTFHEFF